MAKKTLLPSTIIDIGKRADEHPDTLGRNAAERGLSDAEVIARRTAERESLLAKVSGVPVVPQPAPLAAVQVKPTDTSAAGIIATLTGAARSSDDEAAAQKRAQIEADTR